MQVIGEIGGTSSRWAVLHADGATVLLPPKGQRWPGFNPVSGEGTRFGREVRALFTEACPQGLAAREIHVYGAGCGSDERRERMRDALATVWPGARMAVQSDLLGAAIGLCSRGSGLVLILGTGMNAGYFDGERLHTPMPSLGYLLGDEGSGADIGRHLLQDAFHGRIPRDVHELLFGPDGPVLQEVLGRIHGAPHPARELAAYTALLAPHLDRPYVRDLLSARFHALAEVLVSFFKPAQRATVFATGSVAHGFREVLSNCLLDRGMTLTEVCPDPLPGLVLHHRS